MLTAPKAKQPAKAEKLSQQIEELEKILQDGRLSAAIAGAALDRARTERRALVKSDSKGSGRGLAKVAKILPDAAATLWI